MDEKQWTEESAMYSHGRVDGFKRGYNAGHKMGHEKARAKKAGAWFLVGWATMAAMFLIPHFL